MSTASKVGAGKNILNRHECTFHKGSLMFIEGETSTEMYIIRSGLIRILKQEGESTIELARLGPGSVLGELSLLDKQPRGATAQVVEETLATVIDEALLQQTVAKTPSWLSNIIQVVVKRLRSTMKKTGIDIVNKNLAGAVKVILLLHEQHARDNCAPALFVDRLKELLYAIIGLGGLESENVFLHLILKGFVLIHKDGAGREELHIQHVTALNLYMQYLRSQQRGIEFPGEHLSDKAHELIELIALAGEKNGKIMQNRFVQIGMAQVELELERTGKGRHVHPEILDELIELKALCTRTDNTKTMHGTHKRTIIIYNPNTLQQLKLLKEWLPTFREEIEF
ncbi:MAG: cyclic nucleotide-binding domain-containing protein [Chitinivibrionales bacterium]|nr:cyclic nucleotide-binding domain-containing protein [Chitinivibrionales bacterium]